jgi:hypothetical protein
MPVSAFLAKALLDWTLGGATPTRPTSVFLGLASGTPTTVSGSEGPFTRVSATFSAASSPIGTCLLSAVATVLATANGTAFYWLLWDSAAGGDLLMYGPLTASQTLRSGSGGFFNAGVQGGHLTISIR